MISIDLHKAKDRTEYCGVFESYKIRIFSPYVSEMTGCKFWRGEMKQLGAVIFQTNVYSNRECVIGSLKMKIKEAINYRIELLDRLRYED